MAGFKKAEKRESKLRLALAGPAGSGKTFTALTLATALTGDKPVAVIDTERGSASKYADLFEFDVLELEPPYHPDRYMAAMREAEAAGYGVLIIDSLSHAWTGPGGLLEVHEQVVKRQTTKNSYTAWAEVTPIQTRFIDAITGSGLHVIATMRSKTEYVQGEGKNGRAEIRKVGTAPIQRDGMEFEFDVMGEMDQDNTLMVSKTRCPALAGAVIAKPGTPLAETLRAWLSGAPAPELTPKPVQQSSASASNGHASPAKPSKVAQRWSSLQLRMRGLGIIRMTMADEVAQRVVGKDWMEAANQDRDADYDKLLAEVEAQERKADAAKAHFDRGEGVGVAPGAVKPGGHDEIVPQELDLADIETGHPVP